MDKKTDVRDPDEKVVEIEMERLRAFPNHPFKVIGDSQMIELQDSIKKYGVLNPLIVRPKIEGYYEIISGHRRKYAAEKLGYKKIPVIIRMLQDDEAVVIMVDSNLQREQITPSEKAYAYKMKYDAIKKKAGRKNCSQVNHNTGKRSIDVIGELCGDSAKQVHSSIKSKRWSRKDRIMCESGDRSGSGRKVLLIDGDPQGSLTISLGYEEPDEMEYSLATLMMNIVNDEKLNIEKTILHHKEGVDLIPANIELSAIEVSLVNAMSRELILRSMVDRLREFYDYIIIDCMPSLGMMTINALACADSVLIPVQAAYLPVKGLQQLIKTIGRVKKQLNPKLKIEGILLTMVDNRTNYARDISLMVYDTYSASIKVFGTEIPMSVRASEVSVEGGSIYSYDPKGKAAFAYMALTKEVLKEAE